MRRLALVALLGTALGSSPAFSAGWDTPILYSAEHMGMGGAAIGYVDDPSAIVLNPAGLVRAEGLTLMANTSLLLGTITSSPTPETVNEESEGITAVVPLVGLSYKVSDWFAAGLAFYPVASAGATYRYKSGDDEVENSTDVLFLEVSPSVAFQLPANLRLGVGYRVSYVSLTRVLQPSITPLDFSLTGWNLAGLRVGLQWSPSDALELGVVYRHKTETEITDDSATVVIADDPVSAKSTLVLPSKLGFGARVNLAPISLVADLEYTFQDQNDELIIERDPAVLITINNVFRWQNTITLRGGVEYEVADTYLFRGGFIYDGQATQKKFPSAFGTPPGPSTTITAGFGYKPDAPWDLNVALAYRIATATVTQADIDEGTNEKTCLACSKAGDYKLGLFGAYVDFTYSFE